MIPSLCDNVLLLFLKGKTFTSSMNTILRTIKVQEEIIRFIVVGLGSSAVALACASIKNRLNIWIELRMLNWPLEI